MPSLFNHYLAVARSPFLILTPLCVLVGVGDALVIQETDADYVKAGLILLCALCAHIAMNVLNELEDFRSGLDLHTHRTPFSGGSGCLPAHPEFRNRAWFFAKLNILIVIVSGLYLVFNSSPYLLLLGVPGMAVIFSYTRYLNKHPLACLIAPGLAFGPIMIAGSSTALTGELSASSLWLSLPVFFSTNNLLLLNQFPDAETDQQFGRRHAVIAFEKKGAAALYLAQGICFGFIAFAGVASGMAPPLILLSTCFLPLTMVIGVIARNFDNLSEQRQLRLLATNVIISLLTPASLIAALLVVH
ncbi:MAG: prenyltransferase [Pseudomonadales bacterium]|nr:prenyltransferase [Pseudomonadales bacterium]